MTSYTREDLELAERHVMEGEIRVAEQERLVSELRLQGHSTDDAVELATELAETLTLFKAHRDAVAKALDEADKP